MLTTPIAYIIFNRPRHTLETFEAIRVQRPSRLFIIADGPRIDHPTDVEMCCKVRKIVEQVDWPCEVRRNFSDVNLGCKMRPKTGIDWVFSQVDQAIILEDDCLPHPDFFTFCEELLERYKDDERVSVITGDNFQKGNKRGDFSYYFSKYSHTWGWATWKRAWVKNDCNIKFWPEYKSSKKWMSFQKDTVERRYWERIFDRVYGRLFESAWDYPWLASVWYYGGLTATPNVNLVTNIGFGPEGTHTLASDDQNGSPVFPLGQLTHPLKVEQDRKADRYVFDNLCGGLEQRFLTRLLKLPSRIYKKIIQTIINLVCG